MQTMDEVVAALREKAKEYYLALERMKEADTHRARCQMDRNRVAGELKAASFWVQSVAQEEAKKELGVLKTS